MTSAAVFQARAMVLAMLKHGVRQVVIAPGSRNAPLTMALAQVAAENKVQLFTRIDERTAGFTALGMAKRQMRPVAVITTSGTAAAHLLAPAWEASEAGVPLLLITADRPPQFRDRGANQTILQAGMFGESVRADWDLPIAENQDAMYWELAVAGAIAASLGDEFTAPGAVHLNVPFAEPLVPEEFDSSWFAAVEIGELPVIKAAEDVSLAAILAAEKISLPDQPSPGVIICSDPHSARDSVRLALSLGWPLLAEPGSNAMHPAVGVPNYPQVVTALLADVDFQPDVVITAGKFGLSRPINQLVRRAKLHLAVGKFPLDADPFGTAKHHLLRIPEADVMPATAGWLAKWQESNSTMNSPGDWGAGLVMQQVAAHAQASDLVWFAASNTVRVAEQHWPPSHPAMQLMNRGTNGIDGLIAAATGAALLHTGRSFLIVGDIAFLHDAASLMLPKNQTKPNLTIVVLNNREGQIFRTLEQGAEQFSTVYDEVFGTPQDLDLAGIAKAANWPATNVTNLAELEIALNAAAPQVIVVSL